ncbi:MAG TPA: hypothetical protein VFB45_08135 [Pseudolabrys sp.]|nr:hypothetical protein [Pseudolabrys sp.]
MSLDSKDAELRAESAFKRKEQQQRDGKLAMAEYEAATVAMREKTARLRKLREAKEASEQEASKAAKRNK